MKISCVRYEKKVIRGLKAKIMSDTYSSDCTDIHIVDSKVLKSYFSGLTMYTYNHTVQPHLTLTITALLRHQA